MTHPRKLKYTMKGRETTERKVQGREPRAEGEALVEFNGSKGKLFQPRRGVKPSREETIQQRDTAVHECLCVATALYLKAGGFTHSRVA